MTVRSIFVNPLFAVLLYILSELTVLLILHRQERK